MLLPQYVQTAARDIGVQTHNITATVLFYSTIVSRNLHVRLCDQFSAYFSPVHTVSEAPLSSSERLSIIVAALGALKKQQHPLVSLISATGHKRQLYPIASCYSTSKQPNITVLHTKLMLHNSLRVLFTLPCSICQFNCWTTSTDGKVQVARLQDTKFAKSDNEIAPIYSRKNEQAIQHLRFLQLSQNAHGTTQSLDSIQSGVNG